MVSTLKIFQAYKLLLVLILNKRLRRRFSSHVWVNFFEDITKDVIYEVSLTRAGSEGLRKWARRPEV